MPDSQKLKENLIRRLVARLKRGFHSVRVDLATSRHERPNLVRVESEAFRPDVTAYSGSVQHIYAVETEATIPDMSSHERWVLFAEYAAREPECVFYLVVPAGSRDHARLWLMQLSVEAEVITMAVK